MSHKIKLSTKQTQSKPCRGAGGGITLPDTVRFLYANFKSIYQEEENLSSEKKEESADDATQALAKPAPSDFSSGEDSQEEAVQDDCIVILTFAESPFREFRRSMAEMVRVRLERGEKVDWDFLEELLFRYLDLNNDKAHKNILRAFVDLVVVLHENEWRFPEQRR